MKILHIDKASWDKGVLKSGETYRLTGPVKDKDTHAFKNLNDGELPDMGYVETKMSPKALLFPRSEVMLTYSTNPHDGNCNIMKEASKAYPPRAVIGIRPFDAKAIQLVKLNFDTEEYKDPYWLKAYEACTFVGLAINQPSITDFSTSCNTGPFDETGLDVLVVDTGHGFLAKILSTKGQAWADAAGFNIEAGADAASKITAMKKEAEANIVSKISVDKIAGKTVLELFDAGHWEDTAFGCINCGTCTFACPTCWCFDIQDETYGTQGVRIKNWDSCMTGLFTMHGSGHNPREYPYQRTRQRFMHKLKYFMDKYQEGIMCVGCGRCIKQCPANIDIREICNTMNQ
ncbi:MAG: 4Fe-4S dicluster domain-containing protein [Proteobacteria bacterium]|nr:4Fe-4S dicluster domain-containing protein [Pseudomonadota bacterium]